MVALNNLPRAPRRVIKVIDDYESSSSQSNSATASPLAAVLAPNSPPSMTRISTTLAVLEDALPFAFSKQNPLEQIEHTLKARCSVQQSMGLPPPSDPIPPLYMPCGDERRLMKVMGLWTSAMERTPPVPETHSPLANVPRRRRN
jgi:hypothetical protein